MTIQFGTDGWRAVIAEDFTFNNVQIAAQAIADYVNTMGKAEDGLVIGYDTRFLSKEFALECAKVVTGNGIKVYLTDNATPTPVISYAVKYLGTAGGIIVTASHNPAKYNGIKVKADYGGSALPVIMSEIEHHLYATPVKLACLKQATDTGMFVEFNADEPYITHLCGIVDLGMIGKSVLNVVVDPMYGAGSGYLKRILQPYGFEIREIRGEYNPGFGGIH